MRSLKTSRFAVVFIRTRSLRMINQSRMKLESLWPMQCESFPLLPLPQ